MSSKQFIDAQITSIDPIIDVRNLPGKSLYLIKSNLGKGLVQFDYELHSTPNQMAVHRHNHQPNITPADVDHLPADANSFSFKVNNTIALSDKFKEDTSNIVSLKIIPAIAQTMLGLDFISPVDEFYLYQAGKLPVGRNFYWMKECLEKSGFDFSEDKVQVGGKKFVDAFKVQMK
jgi:hypothetical protein